MKIDVVIPNYNGFDLLKKNVPPLLSAMSHYDFGQLIIVDDFSSEEEYKNLSEYVDNLKNSKIRLLRNSRNLGFSSTVNRGVEECTAEFVLILNSDVLVKDKFLNHALDDINLDENVFGVGLADKSIDSRGEVIRGRGLASFKRGFLIHRRGEPDTKDTFWISGGSSLVRRELFDKLGGFDALFNPFYWEDIDLSYRAQKAGYKIMFEPKSEVEHRHEEGAIAKTYNSKKIKSIAYKNQIIFVWKNISDGGLIFSHILWMPYHLLRAAVNFDLPFFSGFFMALSGLTLILKKRRSQRRFYLKRDSDIINP